MRLGAACCSWFSEASSAVSSLVSISDYLSGAKKIAVGFIDLPFIAECSVDLVESTN
jgi:hypothetical protein